MTRNPRIWSPRDIKLSGHRPVTGADRAPSLERARIVRQKRSEMKIRTNLVEQHSFLSSTPVSQILKDYIKFPATPREVVAVQGA